MHRFQLEVSFDAEPIEGRLYDQTDGGASLDRPFSGWLGLMSAIEAARRESSPRGHEEEPR
jgi:hypothetical protein